MPASLHWCGMVQDGRRGAPGPPRLVGGQSRKAKACQSPKATVSLRAEAGQSGRNQSLFGVAVTRCTRQPPSPLTALDLFVCLPRPT